MLFVVKDRVSSNDIAMFFFCRRKDFNVDVLKAFVRLHNFKNLTLVQALR